MAVAGEIRGKVLKAKGNAEREERRGGESLDAEGTRAGCRTVVGAAVAEEGTRMGP